jgi:hypothetical protein
VSLRASFVVAAAVLASCSAPARAPRTRLTVKEIAERSKPAIVQIVAKLPEGDALGTGFAVDASGIIATNLHVVAGAKDIQITTLDGSKYPVTRIIGFDQPHDLALLQIAPKTQLPVLSIGDSNIVEAGDPVIAIGNPAGLDYTVSDGLVSNVHDDPKNDLTVLQISAPISPGSSGGPLFNSFGEVIGTATAIIEAGQNLNLGMPSKYLSALIKNASPMTLDAFATATAPKALTQPTYDATLFDGCSDEQAVQVGQAVQSAIDQGVPLWNNYGEQGHSMCEKIYEGTTAVLSEKAPCAGVRQAFKDSLSRAGALDTDDAKAWSLRYAFDGILHALAVKYGTSP